MDGRDWYEDALTETERALYDVIGYVSSVLQVRRRRVSVVHGRTERYWHHHC